MKNKIRDWVKRKLDLYDIEDLTVGGHCGLCGSWIEKEIFPKEWPYGVCSKCLEEG